LNSYTKKMTPVYNGVSPIEFSPKLFKKLKTISYRKTDNIIDGDKEDHFYLKDLEDWMVFDFTKYHKAELQQMVKEFLAEHSL